MSLSKSCFHNDSVSHSEANKTLTDACFSYQYYYSSFDQPKKRQKKKKKNNHNRPKKWSGQNHFRPKKWSGHGRTGRTADDGLETCMLLSTYLFLRNRLFFKNSLFKLPRQPIKLRESDKSLITVENYSINIFKNKILLSPMRQ